MKSKRVSSLVFISVVLIAIISLTFAFGISAGISGRLNAADAAWEGNGTGTSEDPYLIATKEDLLNFRELVNGNYNTETYQYEGQNVDACAKLIEDIDFEGDNSVSWAVAMIAWDSAYPYAGTFDGNGHTISGLHMNYNIADNLALFGYAGSEAVIKDLTVVGDANCSSGAGIVAQNSGQILRCVNRVELYCNGNGQVGGIVKNNNSTGSIIGCVNEATVKGQKSSNVSINCYVGGIAAYNDGIITQCINNGPVILYVRNTNNYAAGIAGINRGEISYCINNNTVSIDFSTGNASINFLGGIVGSQSNNSGTAKISCCVNNGDAIDVNNISSDCKLGGIAAQCSSNTIIEDCYNTGLIACCNRTGSDTAGICVFIGETASVRNSYNIGEALKRSDGADSTNGYQITNPNYSSFTQNCYYLASETNAGTGALSQNDFADVSKFTDWDFGDKWAMYQEGNGFMRPYLAKTWAAVKYYDKTGEEVTSYAQAKTLWGVDDVIVRLHNSASFASQYDTLYAVGSGVTQDGWATEYKGEKVYDFDEAYTDTETLSLYPAYTLNVVPTVTELTDKYDHEYDGETHNLTVSVTHGDDEVAYQWCKKNVVTNEYESIVGATDNTYGVKYVADSGTYRVLYSVIIDGYEFVYESAEIPVTIDKANPSSISLPMQFATYGETLADISLPDNYAWVDDTQSVGNVGFNNHSAIYTPADSANYNTMQVIVFVNVAKADPTGYTVPSGLAATYGDTLADVSLSAWSGWTWDDTTRSVGDVGNNSFSATFTPEDTANYNTVTTNLTVTVGKATPPYETPTGLAATYGQTLADVTLPEGWAWADTTQDVGNVGEHQFSATFTPSDTANYNTVTTNLTVTVGKATPSYEAPTGLVATIGQTLSDVDLTDGWTWVDDQQELNKVGPYSYAATYTPEDTTHYSVVEIDLEVGVYHGDWTGSGDGKRNSPYVITTKAELEHFRDIVNGYYLKQGQSQNSSANAVLAASIVLGGESEPWTPIGTTAFSGSYYRGVFDGAGFTISGLYIPYNSENDYVGLFGVVSGTVKNLTVSGTVIGKKSGGIAGRVDDGGKAIGCTNEADVTGEFETYRYAGGIVGYVESGTITDCVNKGNVIGYEAGGIAGHIVGGRVENCVNEASASVAASRRGGGIIGELEHAGAYRFYGLSYCINKGAVVNVDGADAYLGGIVGEAECGPISYCYNEGAITNTGIGYWTGGGGMVGRFYGIESCIIENCYNSGVITGGDYVGGMIGMKTGSDFAVVRNSYNIGEITASNDQSTKGEISGTIYSGEITIENCYYLAGESKKGCGSIADAEGVMAPLTAAEFADASNFSGWSFGKVWAMYTVGGETRPYLVKTCVNYYDKTKAATSYAQPRTLLGIDGTLDAVLLYGSDGFVGDYAELYAKDGYAHDGWATTSTGAVAYEFGAEYASNESISLYPHYSVVTYTILYVNALNGASGIVNVNPTTYTIEDEDIVLVSPTRIGYDLTGWTGEGVTIAAGSFGDQVFEAIWTLHAYTIIYTDAENGVNGVTNANPTTYTINDSTIVLSAPSRTDYDFVRWTGDGTTIYAGSTGDRTFVAHWAPHSYTITYVNATDGVGGVTNTNPTTYTVEDEEFELVAPTRIGYELATWSGEGVTLPTGSSGDRIFEATWTVVTYSITYAGEEGATHVDPATYTIEDLPIVISDLARDHYDFIGWANGSADPETGYTIAAGTAGNLTLTATWAPHAYTITYVNAENGVGGVTNANPATYTIEDEAIELVAPTRVGYDLTAWTGEGVTIPAGSYGDKTYEATWTAIVYTITYKCSIEDAVNPNPTTYTIEDLPLVLVKPTSEYYDFIFWKVNDDYKEGYTIPAGTTGDITLGTRWDIKGDIGGGHAFVLEAPAVESLNGYIGTYDGKTHEISATFAEHELDVTYSYRWKKDGVIIQGATGATLTVKDVADSGVYTLLYTVSYDEYTSAEKETAAIVVVIGKKNVTLNLPAVTSVEGNVGNATATVSGAAQGDRIGIIIVYYQGETELAEKPTRAGKYTAVASINEANYDADAVEAAFVINVATIDPENIEKPDGEDITVTSDDGFDEGTELVITKPDSPEDIAEIQEKIGDDKEIVEIYRFEMEEDGEKAELEDPVTIRLPIPEELKDEKFELINVDGDDTESVKYKIDDNYVEFETATMGDFVFVRDKEKKDNTTAVKEESTGGLLDRDGRPSVKLLIYIMLGLMSFNFILTIASIIKMRKL